ncbi:hypothetical protein KSP40_PGU000114 [Platanthera guangdongensis]|uniref:Uncharacterized protein n=1 Tax=Platanthera guangdongensis TaxID=2320717 RepID=A0ABR2MKP8_9ASPA
MAAIAAALPLREYSSTASIGRHLPRSEVYYLHFGLSRPTSIVRTESNVHKEKVKKPNPPCVVCCGSGRVDCRHCEGRGRTNLITLAMLPKGEWPRWGQRLLTARCRQQMEAAVVAGNQRGKG